MSTNKKIYINSYFNAIIVLGGIMIKKKKKKRRLKKWARITLFLLIVLIFLILLLINMVKNTTYKKKKTSVSIEEKIKKKCKKVDYCSSSNIQRYISYYYKNRNLDLGDIIKQVNIGIDYPFYTHTKKAKYLNQEYLLVNKYYQLDKDYIPNNLEIIPEEYARSGMRLVDYAKDYFVKMARAARRDGIKIIAMSSYRSYNYQVDLYDKYAEQDGKKAADTYSARAGFSEHQTGLCVDLYDGNLDYTNFEDSKSFDWMQKNAYKYGFILRFPKDKEHLTGYQYESWHYRYVGKKIAKYIYDHDITFEEYYVQFIENKIKE